MYKLFAGAAIAAFGATQPASAVLIDNFGGGTAPQSYTTQTDLDETGGTILGGQRDTRVGVIGSNTTRYGVSGGTAFMASQQGTVSMQWDGASVGPTLDVSTLNVDLTDGGSSDRFLLDIATFNPSVNQNFTVRIYGPNVASSISGTFSIMGTGILEIPFASLTSTSGSGASAGSATAITLFFSNVLNTAGLSIDSFCTGAAGANCSSGPDPNPQIPEPSTVILLGSALAGLAWRRRRS